MSDEQRDGMVYTVQGVERLETEIDRLRAENAKLRAALKPFADLEPEDIDCDGNGEVIINLDDLRVARAAMGETE